MSLFKDGRLIVWFSCGAASACTLHLPGVKTEWTNSNDGERVVTATVTAPADKCPKCSHTKLYEFGTRSTRDALLSTRSNVAVRSTLRSLEKNMKLTGSQVFDKNAPMMFSAVIESPIAGGDLVLVGEPRFDPLRPPAIGDFLFPRNHETQIQTTTTRPRSLRLS